MNARVLLLTVLMIVVFLGGGWLCHLLVGDWLLLVWFALLFVVAMKWQEKILHEKAYGIEVTIREIGRTCVVADSTDMRASFRFGKKIPRSKCEKLGAVGTAQLWLRKPDGVSESGAEVAPFEFRAMKGFFRSKDERLPDTFAAAYERMIETWNGDAGDDAPPP